MFVVDTNVLLYAANRDALEHAPCRERLESWRRGAQPWYTSWSILYEFVRVVTHPRVLEQPWSAAHAWGFVRALLDSPTHRPLVESDRHGAIVQEVLPEVPGLRGNLLHDFHTAVLMREHGIRRIWTRDVDFHRFPWVEVLDPLG